MPVDMAVWSRAAFDILKSRQLANPDIYGRPLLPDDRSFNSSLGERPYELDRFEVLGSLTISDVAQFLQSGGSSVGEVTSPVWA